MNASTKTIAVINGTGRQAASVIRAVTALGWEVRAQIYSPHPVVAEELRDLPNVTLFEESLVENPSLIDELFRGCQYAFINTFPVGNEVALGKALADGAKRHRIQHYIYGSMPDHSVWHEKWPGLPNWACKFTVENYVRELGLPATFLYAGIYNNNFTSLPYPLFCMEFKDDETIEWKAPFHPHTKLPWLDAEQDTGPAVLQLLKDGPGKWKNRRIALAFENLTPVEVCRSFEKALGRPCKYVFDKHIEIQVPIPSNYREQLAGIEELFGKFNAPYFPGPDFDFFDNALNVEQMSNGNQHSNHTQESAQQKPKKLTSEARKLWPGFRRIEDYAREAFPIEEEANGKTWMRDKSLST